MFTSSGKEKRKKRERKKEGLWNKLEKISVNKYMAEH